MNRLVLKIGIAVIAVPVMAGYTWWLKNKAIDVYHITEVDLPIMENCVDSMNAHNMEFSENVPVVLSCACIAKHATSSIIPAELPVYTDTFEAELDFAAQAYFLNYDDEEGFDALTAKYKKEYLSIQRKAGMSEAQYQSIFANMERFEETCSDVESHKGEALTRIAALAPLGSNSVVETVTATAKKSDIEVARMLR